jgi:predicted metalloprotease with PDZ domain
MIVLRWLVLCAIFCTSFCNAEPVIKYTLDFKDPQTHYVRVRMEIKNWNSGFCPVKLPVWTPGSYMVREYSRFLERLTAFSDNVNMGIKHISKNEWEVKTGNIKNFTIEYYIYAYELTVRTAFIDEEHAYLNGAAIFLYSPLFKNIQVIVQINPYNNWKKISVALDPVEKNNPWVVKADNYDILIDSPFEIGNQAVFSFKAAGINHDVAVFGNGLYDSLAIKKDLTLIIEEEARIFSEHPCKNYLFIVHLIPGGSGGLEHMNSTTIQAGRNALNTTSGYNNFLSLAAHEYFHLWNVKRLRPHPLGPFDYDKENYTSLLYFSEGFTAYYDELITVKCNLVKPEAYLKALASSISTIENTPGNSIQSLAEAGFDAWIKYYRTNENSINSTISYYTKGAVMGAMLDILLLNATSGKSGLDQVMSSMYDEYYKKLNRGFTDEELIAAAEKVGNCSWKDVFSKYIYNTAAFPYDSVLNMAGIKLVNSNAGTTSGYVGINTLVNGSKVTVSNVERNGPAWQAGLNVNDEIIAIDFVRLTEDPQKIIGTITPGSTITFTVSRSGLIKEIKSRVVASPKVAYEAVLMENRDEKKQLIYKKWLGIK